MGLGLSFKPEDMTYDFWHDGIVTLAAKKVTDVLLTARTLIESFVLLTVLGCWYPGSQTLLAPHQQLSRLFHNLNQQQHLQREWQRWWMVGLVIWTSGGRSKISLYLAWLYLLSIYKKIPSRCEACPFSLHKIPSSQISHRRFFRSWRLPVSKK